MTNIPYRGRLSERFATSLLKGKLTPIIEFILNDEELDIQVRDNYLNVYYRGGNILRIKPQSFSFDEYYFYLPNPDDFPKSYVQKVAEDKRNEISPRATKTIPSRDEAEKIVNELENKRKTIIGLLNDSPASYFSAAKPVMDKWFAKFSHQEREDQQKITCNNRKFSDDNNLVVLDIEFAVSVLKEYNTIDKVCRFDIIAIDETGQLYIIELKQNQSADEDGKPANVKEHIADFNATIGQDKNGDFAKEMLHVLETKQMLGYLSKDLKVDTTLPPIFAVAYSGDNADAFNAKYRASGVTVVDIDKSTMRLNK